MPTNEWGDEEVPEPNASVPPPMAPSVDPYPTQGPPKISSADWGQDDKEVPPPPSFQSNRAEEQNAVLYDILSKGAKEAARGEDFKPDPSDRMNPQFVQEAAHLNKLFAKAMEGVSIDPQSVEKAGGFKKFVEEYEKWKTVKPAIDAADEIAKSTTKRPEMWLIQQNDPKQKQAFLDELRSKWAEAPKGSYWEKKNWIHYIPFVGLALKAEERFKIEDELQALRAHQEGKMELPPDKVQEYTRDVWGKLLTLEEMRTKGVALASEVESGVLQALPFMVEMVATGGIAGGVRGAATKGLTELTGAAAMQGVKGAALRGGIQVAGVAAGEAARALFFAGMMAENYAQNVASDYTVSTDGKVHITGDGDKPATAVLKAVGSTYIELLTEQSGEGIKAAGAGAGKLLGKGVSKYLPTVGKFMGKLTTKLGEAWSKVSGGSKTEFVKKMATKAGFHGVLEEMGEERLGDILRAITNTEPGGGGLRGEDNTLKNRLLNAIPDGRQLLVEAATFALVGAGAGAARAGANAAFNAKDLASEDAFKTWAKYFPEKAKKLAEMQTTSRSAFRSITEMPGETSARDREQVRKLATKWVELQKQAPSEQPRAEAQAAPQSVSEAQGGNVPQQQEVAPQAQETGPAPVQEEPVNAVQEQAVQETPVQEATKPPAEADIAAPEARPAEDKPVNKPKKSMGVKAKKAEQPKSKGVKAIAQAEARPAEVQAEAGKVPAPVAEVKQDAPAAVEEVKKESAPDLAGMNSFGKDDYNAYSPIVKKQMDAEVNIRRKAMVLTSTIDKIHYQAQEAILRDAIEAHPEMVEVLQEPNRLNLDQKDMLKRILADRPAPVETKKEEAKPAKSQRTVEATTEIKPGEPIDVYRGDLGEIPKKRKNLSGIQSIEDVVGMEYELPLAPFEFFTADESNAEEYGKMDVEELAVHEKRSPGKGKEIFETLHGHAPRTNAKIRKERITPKKTLDLRKLGANYNTTDLVPIVNEVMGNKPLPKDWKWKDVEDVDKVMTKYGLWDALKEEDSPIFGLFRNRMSPTESILVKQGKRKINASMIQGSLFSQFLRDYGYDSVAHMLSSKGGDVVHIVMVRPELMTAEYELKPDETSSYPVYRVKQEPTKEAAKPAKSKGVKAQKTTSVADEISDLESKVMAARSPVRLLELQKAATNQSMSDEAYRDSLKAELDRPEEEVNAAPAVEAPPKKSKGSKKKLTKAKKEVKDADPRKKGDIWESAYSREEYEVIDIEKDEQGRLKKITTKDLTGPNAGRLRTSSTALERNKLRRDKLIKAAPVAEVDGAAVKEGLYKGYQIKRTLTGEVFVEKDGASIVPPQNITIEEARSRVDEIVGPKSKGVKEKDSLATTDAGELPKRASGTKEAMSQHAIIAGMARNFDVTMRRGGLRKKDGKKVLGEFKRFAGVVRMDKDYVGDIGVASHEVAHKIDQQYKFTQDMPFALRQELSSMDYDQERNPEEMTGSVPTAVKEGFAEYMRHYFWTFDNPKDFDEVASDVKRLIDAKVPTFHAFFQNWVKQYPDLAAKIETTREEIYNWRKAGDLEREMKNINRTGKAPDRRSLLERTRDLFTRNYTRWKDKGHIFDLFSRKAKELGFAGPESVYQLYLAFDQSGPAMAARAAEHGVFKMTGKMETIGPKFSEILENIPLEDQDKWELWAWARHARECWEKGVNPGMERSTAGGIYETYKNETWENAAEKLTDYNNALIDMLTDVGVLEDDKINIVKGKEEIIAGEGTRMKEHWKTYLTLRRVKSIPSAGELLSSKSVPSGKKYANLTDPVMRRVGSGDMVYSPLQSALERTQQFYTRAAQQVVINQIVETIATTPGMGAFAERIMTPIKRTNIKLGDVATNLKKQYDVDLELPQGVKPETVVTMFSPDLRVQKGGKAIVRHSMNGVTSFYEVDPEFYKALTGMNFLTTPLIFEPIAAIARATRAGATGLSTTFAGANVVRDYVTYLMQTKYGEGTTQFTDPMKQILVYAASEVNKMRGGEGDIFVELYKGMAGEMSTKLGSDLRKFRKFIESQMAQSKTKKVLREMNPLNFIEMARKVINLSEIGPRMAEFEAVMRKYGISKEIARSEGVPRRILVEAINAANDATINFKRTGSWGQFVNRFVPFFNAGLEGQDKYIRTWRDNPMRAAVGTGSLIAAQMLYWLYRKDDDDYKDQPGWLKYFFWTFADGDGQTFLRLPRPFEWNIIPSGVEMLLNHYEDETSGEFSKWLWETIQRQTPTVKLAGVTQAMETFFNYDFFRGDQIYKGDTYNKTIASKQYLDHTTETMKAIGEWTGIAPYRLEHFINSSTGGLYKKLVGTGEAVAVNTYNTIWGLPDPEKKGQSTAENAWYNFVPLTLRKNYTQSEIDFRDKLDTVEREYNASRPERGAEGDPKLKADLWKLRQYKELITEVKGLVFQQVGRDAKFDFEKYADGLSRQALGRANLQLYPSMFNTDDLPPEIKEIKDEFLGRILYQVTSPMENKSREERDAIKERSSEWLDDLSDAEKRRILLQESRNRKAGVDSILRRLRRL